MAAALSVLAGAASAKEAVGDWLGPLAVSPYATLRVAVHIRRAADGSLAGSLDSLDQAAFDMPLTEVKAGSDTLSFAVPSISARYDGQWDETVKAWVGHWVQGKSLPLSLAAGATPAPVTAAGVDGDWDGVLAMAGGVRLRLALHIATGPHGTLGEMNSLDQGAKAPIAGVSRKGATVRIDLPVIAGVFTGDLDAAGQAMTGQWTQLGAATPLTLTRRKPRRSGGDAEAAADAGETVSL